MRGFRLRGALALLILGLSIVCGAGLHQNSQRLRGGQSRDYPTPKSAWLIADILLGSPRTTSIDLVVHPKTVATFRIIWDLNDWSQSPKSKDLGAGKVGQPIFASLDGLSPDSEYVYRLDYRPDGEAEFSQGPSHKFHSQRATGRCFKFVVQGDSHPERNPKMNVPELYERTLLAAEALQPDFFICLGDDFSVDNLREISKETVRGAYAKQVPYLGLVGRSAPVFLVNGNHEQAAKANYDGTADCLGVLAQTTRNSLFPQPAPDGFYTGNQEKLDHIGFLRNYYAWTWGDALFVMIDPYWHSDVAVDNAAGKGPKNDGGGKRNRDLWNVTLGKAQYDWLNKTLAGSKARYKFVFAHHVHGTGRGGVELAPYYEWGGLGRNGSSEFKERRPGWAMPIHELFVKNGVTIFFQGHDHIFCKQELDGVVYQSCPVPADKNNVLINGDAYLTGDKVVGAGLVAVEITPSEVKVEFQRSYLPAAETDGRKQSEVAYSYTLKPKVAQ